MGRRGESKGPVLLTIMMRMAGNLCRPPFSPSLLGAMSIAVRRFRPRLAFPWEDRQRQWGHLAPLSPMVLSIVPAPNVFDLLGRRFLEECLASGFLLSSITRRASSISS